MHESILDALRRQDTADALRLAQAWVAEAADDAQAQRWLALARQQHGDTAGALDSIDRAIALAPEDAELHLLRASILVGANDLPQAEVALAQTAALDPNAFMAYIMRGHLALGRGDLDEVERLSRTAARLQPEHPQLLGLDGMLALRRGDADRALALLSRASNALPDDPRLLYALGFAYLDKQHLAFAETAFRRVATLTPGTSVPMMALVAQLAHRQGRLDDAIAALETVLADPAGDTANMRRLAGEYALQADRPAQALEHLRPALAAVPADRRTLHAALIAWQRLGTLDDARATLEAALTSTTDAHDLWLARLALEPVGGAEARALIARWQAAMPAHVPALEAQLRVHDMAGERDQGEAVAQRIVALEPGRISGEERLVEAMLERGEHAAAIDHVCRLMQRLPEQNRTILRPWLAAVQDAAGRVEDALATWLAFQQEQQPHRLPLPPLGQAGQEALSPWPPLAAVDAQTQARPLFVWGAPGSGVERVIAVLSAASPVLRGDRFGAQPPSDGLQRYRSVGELDSGALDGAALVAEWRAQLPARGIGDGNIVDWLLWWDNVLLRALRPHLPEGRLLIVLRDPRDMLLDWLANGAPAPLQLASPEGGARWLAAVLEQIAVLHAQDLYPHRLLRLDGIETDPAAVAAALEQAFGVPFPTVATLGPPRLAAGHWRAYAGPLAAAFVLLTPVAMRLGYPAS
ncbi:tetratricopeptide repeat protein [Xanthomonas albilineans]|uniref:tetratricopeptide repeat protein n=1 Tax=Xanthomonas albilineans TaxID=29447 RepID=UPI0005F35DD8|nr:tetratricopeptide repeat protein [Xanthomonas albilineans]